MPSHLLIYYPAYYLVTLKKNYPSLQYQVLPFIMKCMIQLLEQSPACLPAYLPNQPVNNSLQGCLINNVVGK